MTHSARRAAMGYPRTLENFLGLRMMILALVVGAGIMIIQLSQSGFPVRPLYIMLMLSYVVGGLIYAGFRMGVKPVMATWCLMVSDIFLETGFLHFSGGVTSQFSLIFCLTIIASAFLLQVSGGMGIALLASACYIVYGILEAKKIISPPVSGLHPALMPTPGFLKGYLHVSIFFLVGAVGGYLAERTRLKGRLLESAETELKQLKVDTDHILSNMSSGVLVMDSEGRILTINPAAEEILGMPRDRILSKDINEVFRARMPEFAHELEFALKVEKSRFRHEINVRREDNRVVPLGISISLLKDENCAKRGVIAVFQDLTEVREMQERIRQADRLAAIGELSAGIAHEIRNPLASISGSIEMLHKELDLSGENKRLMQLILKESDRLDRIVNDFLEYARMSSPTKRKVSIAQSIEDVVVLVSNRAEVKRGITIETVHEHVDQIVMMDEEQMKQVFLNLTINACEAMHGKGKLIVKTGTMGNDWLKISFLDEGHGIFEADRRRLFEPFFTTKEGGTGLGLAIANKIVEAHGGRIEVKNRQERGAEFAILLPLNSSTQSRERFEAVRSVT